MQTAYRQYLEKRGRTDNTIRRYLLSVKNFGLYIAPRGFDKADSDDVEEWSQREHLCLRTRSQYLTDLRVFYKWGVRYGHFKANPCDRVEGPKPPPLHPRNPPDADLERCFLAADWDMKAIMLFMSLAGLRCCEVAGLNREDIRETLELPRIDVHYGKGGKFRAVALAEEIVPFLAYLPARGPLFPNRFGNAVQADTMSKRTRRFFISCGVPDLKAHMLRHWFATNLAVITNGNVEIVQRALGHSDPATTMRYIGQTGIGTAPYVNKLTFHGGSSRPNMTASGDQAPWPPPPPPPPPRRHLRAVD
jgi:integrase